MALVLSPGWVINGPRAFYWLQPVLYLTCFLLYLVLGCVVTDLCAFVAGQY